MSDTSNFESRTGKLTCTAAKLFAFVTDIRNFERFVPSGSIRNWQAEREFCSFNVSMLGIVTVRLLTKEKFTKVVYNGDALKKNDFELVLEITDNNQSPAEAKVLLSADLNPVMKMMADKPVKQFLEMLISEMEKFNSWDDIRE